MTDRQTWMLSCLLVLVLIPGEGRAEQVAANAASPAESPVESPVESQAVQPSAPADPPEVAANAESRADSQPVQQGAPTGPPEVAAESESPPIQPSAMDDPQEGAAALVRGSLKACEVPLMPLALIPGVDSVIEWACLIPAALTLNHYGVRDARRHSYYLQPALALVAGKLVQDALTTPYYVGLGVGTAVYLGAATGVALLGFPWLWPVAAAGLLALAGGSYLLFEDLSEDLFLWMVPALFLVTSPEIGPDDEAPAADDVELFDQPLPGWVRPWALVAVAAGVRAESELSHWVPVLGAFSKGENRARRVQAAMRWVGREELHAPPQDPEAMDEAIENWATVEAAVTASSQALFIAAGGLCLIGLGFGTHAAYQVDQGENADTSTVIAATVGSVGIATGLVGVAAALLRKLPSAGLALSAAWHFGLFAEEEEVVTAPVDHSPEKPAG